jgi:hypothetical protein
MDKQSALYRANDVENSITRQNGIGPTGRGIFGYNFRCEEGVLDVCDLLRSPGSSSTFFFFFFVRSVVVQN